MSYIWTTMCIKHEWWHSWKLDTLMSPSRIEHVLNLILWNFSPVRWITTSCLRFPFSETFPRTSHRCHCKCVCWCPCAEIEHQICGIVCDWYFLKAWHFGFYFFFYFRVHNRISELSMDQLLPFESLETLDLTSNSISELKAGSFPFMQLKYL